MARKKEIYDDSWMYILLLTTLAILALSIKTYKFTVLSRNISYTTLLLPLIYFNANYITKKYGYTKTLLAISISGVGMVLFVLLMNFALGKISLLSGISGEFCAYVTSQLVNLTIYNFLLKNTEMPFFLILLNYIFALIVFYMFYTLIYLNMFVTTEYWKSYFVILAVQSVICLILTIIDKKIKLGRE